MKALAAVAALALVGVGVVADHTAAHPQARPVSGRTQAISDVTLVCPDVTGKPAVTETRVALATTSAGPVAVHVTAPTGQPSAGPATVSVGPTASITAPPGVRSVLLHVSGPGAGTVAADSSTLTSSTSLRGLRATPCVAPRPQWWFTGGSGAVGAADSLVLVNPGAAPTQVSVSVTGAGGLVTAPTVPPATIAPGAQLGMALAQLDPGGSAMTLHVIATGGGVAAALVHLATTGTAHSPVGGEWIPATSAPATTQVLTGLEGGQGTRRLVLGNAGTSPAHVHVQVLTRSDAFTPTGAGSVTVPAGGAASLPLTSALAGLDGGLLVQSDQPVTAAAEVLRVTRGPVTDTEWVAATDPLAGTALLPDPAVASDDAPQLAVATAGSPATVTVAGPRGRTTLRLSADRSVFLPLATLVRSSTATLGPVTVTASGSAWVMLVQSGLGAHGPLVAAEPVSVLPGPVTVPAVEENTGPLPLPAQP